MLSYPFDSVHAALSWYFNRSWIANGRPALPQSLPPIRYDGSPKRDDTEKVGKAYLSICAVLDLFCTAREHCIIYEHYRRKGATQAEVALSYDLSGGERSIRYIKNRVLSRLQEAFIQYGVVKLPKKAEAMRATE